MFRRSGYRFADKNMRQQNDSRASPESEGTGLALDRTARRRLQERREEGARRLRTGRAGGSTVEQVRLGGASGSRPGAPFGRGACLAPQGTQETLLPRLDS